MKFFDYLDSRYVSANLELQKEYSQLKKAETTAIHDIISTQRTLLKWFSYFRIIFGYLFVVLGLKDRPKTTEEMQSEQRSQLESANQQAQNNTETLQESAPIDSVSS